LCDQLEPRSQPLLPATASFDHRDLSAEAENLVSLERR